MVRLVALDIDGTLLDSSGRLPDANQEAVAAVVAAGLEVVLVTGRRFGFARPIADALPGVETLIVSNGALVKDRAGATLARLTLAAEVARRVLADTLAFRDVAGVVFDRPLEGQMVFERIDWDDPLRRQYFAINRAFLDERAPLEAALVEDPVQLVYTGTVARMRDLDRLLAGVPYRREFSVMLTEYDRRDFSLIDVVPAGCSKGAAVRAWAAGRGIEGGEVMAIGDNFNDVEMLEFAGLAVVMGNAVAGLKQRGWPVTGTNDEGGVAAALGLYVLDRGGV